MSSIHSPCSAFSERLCRVGRKIQRACTPSADTPAQSLRETAVRGHAAASAVMPMEVMPSAFSRTIDRSRLHRCAMRRSRASVISRGSERRPLRAIDSSVLLNSGNADSSSPSSLLSAILK
eukprot:scaffold37707_cov69-Phaeocystis_antarctica.AAC.2